MLVYYTLIKDPQAQKFDLLEQPPHLILSKYFDECKSQIRELKKYNTSKIGTPESGNTKNTLYDLINMEKKTLILSYHLDREECRKSVNKYIETCSAHTNGLITLKI